MNNMQDDLLYSINLEKLKKMSIKELEELAIEIRKFLIDKISTYGGHLSSNLGVVEATIALHYVFDSPKDKIIFDVGHQGYVHKILTGRAKDFENFRHVGSISGFLKENESIHDVFEAGHSSTSISAMCGFLEAKKYNSDIGEVVSFIGDASLQSGISLAGINYLASQKNQKGIIILNDNEMSITKNVGGLTDVFNRLRVRKSYKFLRKITPKFIKKALKSVVYSKVSYFTELGYRYLGPIDGHNIKDLIKYFRFAKESKESVIIHIKTIKGKGYEFSENDKTGFYHGVGPFDKTTGKSISALKENEISFSLGASKILEDVIINSDKNIKIITPAMTYGLGLSDFAKRNPDKIIDVGICEENAVIMASTMAKYLVPIVMSYSTFYQRAYDQINHDVCRSNKHVIMLSDRAGLVPFDGDTHQGIFDISMLLPLPNINIYAPKDLSTFKCVLQKAIKDNSPAFIRYPKCNIKEEVNNIQYYNFKIINGIHDVNILSYGPVINLLNEYYKNDIGIIEVLSLKQYDEEMLKMLRGKTVICFEEVIHYGSYYSYLLQLINEKGFDIKLYSISLNEYVNFGNIDELQQQYHLSFNDIDKLIEKIRKKN